MRGRKPSPLRDGAHLALLHFSERKQDVLKLRLRDLIEKIRLIFSRIRRLQKKTFIPFVRDIAIVSRGDIIGAQRERVFLERPEFDLAVAKNVGIGRSAALILLQEIRKHPFAVFFRKIDRIIRNADQIAHAPHVLVILLGGAAAVFVVLFPVDHKKSDDVVALLLQ